MTPCRVVQVAWAEAQAVLEAIRREVFVREQLVPEELEWDGRDPEAWHFLAYGAQGGQALGTVRLLSEGKITRMAVLKPHRHLGVGAALLREALALAKRQGKTRVYLDAQIEARGFYGKFGFSGVGDVFLDAGIPHQRMILTFGEAP